MTDQRPTGTVTFLFTDIEGSTRLLKEVGHATYEELLATHRRLLRQAIEQAEGTVVDMQGDALPRGLQERRGRGRPRVPDGTGAVRAPHVAGLSPSVLTAPS